MEYLRSFYKHFRIFRREDALDVQPRSRFNAYLNHTYRILVWEDPCFSWAALGAVHVLFWLLAYLEIRFLGMFFLAMLSFLLMDSYFEYRGLEEPSTASSEAVRKVGTFFSGIYHQLMVLRKESHAMFCGLMVCIFVVLSIMAKNIDGYLLAYSGILNVFFVPLLISKLPPQYIEHFKTAVQTISTNEGMLAERELIPFLSEKDRNNTELDSLDGKPDSISSSLIVGMSSMPSYQEAEGSLDGLDEEDLELPAQPSRKYIPAPEENSSESELEERNIDFDSTHFDGDTSSEDENDLGKGLKFSEEYTKDYVESLNKDSKSFQETLVQKMGEAVLGNLASVSSSLLSNILQQKTDKKSMYPESENSSSTSSSDFEMIGSDELEGS